ncbi:MAG TPA: glycosyltransferase family 2 protein [Candidatus Paceibacterota bacterium]|nr:glycosyltransferase family 2 protein [Candidatus Paceibacterota bacterium]
MTPEYKNRVSAYVIVYNEEKKITACLESLKNCVDEIIVIHDGLCDDATLDIAREYTDKVFVEKRLGVSDPHRVEAINRCQYEWVLQLDADERLSPELKNNLPKIISNENADAYSFNWVAEVGGRRTTFLRKQFLFRKKKMYLIALQHFQAETYGILSHLNYDMLHDTSEFDSPFALLIRYIKKDYAWGVITAKMISGDLSEIPVFNCSVTDSTPKQINKIKFMKKHPLVSMFIIPPYSFFNAYVLNRAYLHGWLGLVTSCHIPLHSFFACFHLLRLK